MVKEFHALLDETEKLLDKEGERIDEFGDDRIEQERNALCWLREALNKGLDVAVKNFNSSINDIYGG